MSSIIMKPRKGFEGLVCVGGGEVVQAMGEVWTNSWDKGISHRLVDVTIIIRCDGN